MQRETRRSRGESCGFQQLGDKKQQPSLEVFYKIEFSPRNVG